MKKLILALLVSLMATAVLAGCGGGEKTVTVASKDFTEQFILGEMYALMLEDAGYTVERKLNLGGTPVTHQALLDEAQTELRERAGGERDALAQAATLLEEERQLRGLLNTLRALLVRA